MNPANFTGTGVAIVTPFKKDKAIDYIALEKHVEFLVGNGVNYLVILGTSGESVTQSDEEKIELTSFVVKKVNKRIPLVLGIGGNNTTAVINKIQKTDLNGIDGILSVTPYYNKPSQAGLYEHFKAIAQASSKPIILYNVPGRTSVNMKAETTLKLAIDFKNIIAIKEASGDISQAMYLVKDKPKDFLIISGEDALALPLIMLGFSGVISVVGNAMPNEFSTMVKLALENNFKDAKKLHYKLIEFTDHMFVEGNPSGVKAALEILGIMENNLRLPLVPVSDNTYKKIETLIKKIKS
ncbi:MAG: 4-hydroxy-tetrahydrodipicolinate synthase [Bacteroidetes bacterium GWF2_33_16]|nr:MAG: 4-hydroxy-tetrahydrodipicolinate synthase [Bacteroidetes bacterium GWE2_32_14]OFY07154.1 MAG: 4-hydroxy-tetrahydrodipicolinate synthase [Bacteroidetes bacterium GWF2_33_16]